MKSKKVLMIAFILLFAAVLVIASVIQIVSDTGGFPDDENIEDYKIALMEDGCLIMHVNKESVSVDHYYFEHEEGTAAYLTEEPIERKTVPINEAEYNKLNELFHKVTSFDLGEVDIDDATTVYIIPSTETDLEFYTNTAHKARSFDLDCAADENLNTMVREVAKIAGVY